jgi:hypothetical protein
MFADKQLTRLRRSRERAGASPHHAFEKTDANRSRPDFCHAKCNR